MFKQTSLTHAVVLFLAVSGTSGFITHLTLREVRPSARYVCSNLFGGPPSVMAEARAETSNSLAKPKEKSSLEPFDAGASVAGLTVQSPSSEFRYSVIANATQEDIDLGEIFIRDHD